MKRILALAVVMGLFYVTMISMSSAQQKEKEAKANALISQKQSDKKEQNDSNYNRDDLKTNLARAYYDALGDVENDIEDEEIKGSDGKKRSVLQEARRTIFQADKILARVKAENNKALAKLRNPPHRVFPQRKKVEGKKDQQALKKEIEAQKELVKKQQQKLKSLEKELISAPTEKE